jgi:hypothetical protein
MLSLEMAATRIARFNEAFNYLAIHADCLRASANAGLLTQWEVPLLRGLLRLNEAALAVYPAEFLNYSIAPLSAILRKLESSLGILGSETEQPIFLVGFPSPQSFSSLQHTLLFHELGHAYIWESGELGQLIEDWAFDETQFDELAAASDLQTAASQQEALQSWLVELICDAIGATIGGHAFVAAACEFFGTMGGMSDTQSHHPPSALRLKILLERLPVRGSAFGAAEPFFAEWQAIVNTLAAALGGPLVERTRAAVDAIWSAGLVVVPSTLKFDRERDLTPLLERLTLRVPPDSWGYEAGAKPATLAESLNAGWLAYLSELCKGNVELKRRREIERLTGESIELAEARRRWDEV